MESRLFLGIQGKTVEIILEKDGKGDEVLDERGLKEEEDGFWLKERAPHPNSKSDMTNQPLTLLKSLHCKRLGWRRDKAGTQHGWKKSHRLGETKEAMEIALQETETKIALQGRTATEMTGDVL